MPQKKKAVANKQVQLAISYRAFFSTLDGKKILYDLMKAGFFLSSEYNGDPYEIVFREGARSMVSRILKLTKTDPGKLADFIKQREEEEESNEFL